MLHASELVHEFVVFNYWKLAHLRWQEQQARTVAWGFYAARVVGTTIVLALDWDKPCDQPLKVKVGRSCCVNAFTTDVESIAS